MDMQRKGITDLPLHGGKAPWWLLKRMKGMSKSIVDIIVDEYGQEELIRRMADPYWFQALSCVLAYDWHSSGTTTVLCGVLKSVIEPSEHGVGVAGGKGKNSRNASEEISRTCDLFGTSGTRTDNILRASKMSAKVDGTAIQDGYGIYHHCVFFDERGYWSIVQQGLNPDKGYARRYQWLDGIESFVTEPHTGICGRREDNVLDLTSHDSKDAQGTITDIVKEDPTKVKRMFESLREPGQAGLESWMEGVEHKGTDVLKLPSKVNWGAIKKAYEWGPKNFEELLETRGLGAKTLRGLALVSQLIYGDRPSWEDPVRYSFAYGGKDGVPYPVERKAMDESVGFLKMAIDEAKIGKEEKRKAFRGLEKYAGRIRKK